MRFVGAAVGNHGEERGRLRAASRAWATSRSASARCACRSRSSFSAAAGAAPWPSAAFLLAACNSASFAAQPPRVVLDMPQVQAGFVQLRLRGRPRLLQLRDPPLRHFAIGLVIDLLLDVLGRRFAEGLLPGLPRDDEQQQHQRPHRADEHGEKREQRDTRRPRRPRRWFNRSESFMPPERSFAGPPAGRPTRRRVPPPAGH